MSKNDITGDRLVSKPTTKDFEENYEKVDFKPYHCWCITKCYKGCNNIPSGGKGDAYEDVIRESTDSI